MNDVWTEWSMYAEVWGVVLWLFGKLAQALFLLVRE